jgi:CHAT domain-containing protein
MKARRLLGLLSIAMLVVPCAAQDAQFQALMQVFQTQWRAKDYSMAASTMQRALDLANKSGKIDELVEARRWLRSAYQILGQTQKAVSLSEQNLILIRQHRDHFNSPPQNRESEELGILGLLYTKLGDYDRGLKYLREDLDIQRGIEKSGGFAGAGIGNALRSLGMALFVSGDSKGAEQALREGYESLHKFWSFVSEGATNEGEVEILRWLERVLVAEQKTDEALEVAQRCRGGELGVLLASRFGIGSAGAATIPTIQQIRQIARDQQATLVEYSIAYNADPVIPLQFSEYQMLPAGAIFIWVIKPTGEITFRKREFGQQGLLLTGLVRKSRESMGVRGRGAVAVTAPTLTQSVPALRELHNLLIAPIEEFLPKDPNARVIVIPQDILFLVPFGALRDQAGRYFIEKHTLTTEISLQVLQLSQERLHQLAGQTAGALVVGNPAMPPGLPPLLGAEKEAVAVAGLFGAEAMLGKAATKPAVLQHMGKAGIIHLATHGLLDSGGGQLNALALAPSPRDAGFLKAREIGAYKTNAELAILSACDTGQGTLTGDGVLGLARSFVEAGVPSIIVSLWAVPDAPTVALILDFYKNLRNGLDKAQSLRGAMLTTMKQYPQPLFWAAFTLIGAPSASAMLRNVHGSSPASPPQTYFTVLPIPEGVQEYKEFSIKGSDNLTFVTDLSAEQIVEFYRAAFAMQGFVEREGYGAAKNGLGTLTFHSQNDRSVNVNISEFIGKRSVSLIAGRK